LSPCTFLVDIHTSCHYTGSFFRATLNRSLLIELLFPDTLLYEVGTQLIYRQASDCASLSQKLSIESPFSVNLLMPSRLSQGKSDIEDRVYDYYNNTLIIKLYSNKTWPYNTYRTNRPRKDYQSSTTTNIIISCHIRPLLISSPIPDPSHRAPQTRN
jgi:hypothetical protein